MDTGERKRLIEEYKYRKTEIGVFSVESGATGEKFLGRSKDIPAEMNSLRFKLSSGMHPNRPLQALWDRYGEADLKFSVVRLLEYEDPSDDHSKELGELFDKCLAEDPRAVKIWR